MIPCRKEARILCGKAVLIAEPEQVLALLYACLGLQVIRCSVRNAVVDCCKSGSVS
jgi:hypothetical protein